jgi:hypothetical protein
MVSAQDIIKNLPSPLGADDVNEEDGNIIVDIGLIESPNINGEVYAEIKGNKCKINASVSVDIVTGVDSDGDEDIDTEDINYEKTFNADDSIKVIGKAYDSFVKIGESITKGYKVIVNDGKKSAEFKQLKELVEKLI